MTDTRAGKRERLMAQVKRRGGRGDRSPLGTWFWDIDRMLLALTAVLIAIGLIAVAAASPATAARYSGEAVKFPPLYYFWRQLMWVGVSLPVLIATSMLPVPTARRLAVIGTGVLLAFRVGCAQRSLGGCAVTSQTHPSSQADPMCDCRCQQKER